MTEHGVDLWPVDIAQLCIQLRLLGQNTLAAKLDMMELGAPLPLVQVATLIAFMGAQTPPAEPAEGTAEAQPTATRDTACFTALDIVGVGLSAIGAFLSALTLTRDRRTSSRRRRLPSWLEQDDRNRLTADEILAIKSEFLDLCRTLRASGKIGPDRLERASAVLDAVLESCRL
jgi:hypothetical protein